MKKHGKTTKTPKTNQETPQTCVHFVFDLFEVQKTRGNIATLDRNRNVDS